jgi:hypothetical protein
MLKGWKALLFVGILSLFAADVSVGCGQGYVYGPVTQKYASGADTGDHLISVNGTAYDVPLGFFTRVHLGDTVKFDGKAWTVVKRAQAPATPAPAYPSPSTP